MQQANLKEIKLKLPQNVVESLAKNEIVSLLLDKAFNKTEYYLTQSREMQQKYGMDFSDFKKKVEKNKEEVFEEWDDLMEWEAYELAYKEWKTKYEELKNGDLIMRWDNRPHWHNLKTFPHHKHVGAEVLPSHRVTLEEVLTEMKGKLKK